MINDRQKMLLEQGELVYIDGDLVCNFCKSDCGQCGLTSSIVKIPKSLKQQIDDKPQPKKPWYKRIFKI